MNSIASYGARLTGDKALPVATVATSNGIFDRHRPFPPSTSLLIETSFADEDYRLASMCSSPVMVGLGGGGGGGVGGGGVGVRPSSVETDESIVSRSPDADRDPIDEDQDDLSDRVLDQILREHGGSISFGNAVQSFESCFEPTPFQSKAKSKRSEGSLCRVCGDEATGMYFGALVCVPCKTFYLRYAGSNQSFSCKEKRCCAITVASRTNCKFCRYQKCIRVGMHRKERPCQVHVTDGQHVCSVCHDVANGVHFGVITCEGCKKFFRRGLVENHSYVCKNNGRCEVNPRTRNACRFCRYQKCLHVGMSREAIQMGRPSKPRFEKDSSSSQESLLHSSSSGTGAPPPPPLVAPLRNPFDSSANHRPNAKQTTTTNVRCNLQSSSSSGGRQSSAINSVLPFSQPLLNHLITNQQHISMATNSSSHSIGGKSGLRFPIDVLQKTMQPNENRWNVVMATYQQQQQQPLPLLTTRDAAAAAAAPSSANLWSSIDSLNGGEMVEVTTINDEDDRLISSPKQEFHFLDDFSDTIADNDRCDNGRCDNGRCFGFYSSDDGSSVAADQPIPTDYFVDKRSRQITAAAASEDGGQQLMWSVGRPGLSSPSSSSSSRDQSPMTLATVLSSSHSTKSRDNSFSSLSARFNVACGKSVKTSASLPNNTSSSSIALEMPNHVTTNDDDDDDASNNELNDALSATHPHPPPPPPPSSEDEEISRRRHRIYLQFPLKSVIKIIHSSVANELPDDTKNCQMPMNIEELMNRYKNYWLHDETTGEDPFIVHYSNIYQEVIAAYKTFVIHSQYVNFLLRTELEKCQSASNYNVVDVQWIQDNVVPFYVELSIRYCRQLPGFSSFDLSDQQMLIRLGQSPSRILAAAVHWYRPDKRDFGDFLSWRRNDQFKRLMVEHAVKIHALDLDLVEASLLNAALIIATDYPNLVNPEPIERQHQDLLSAYKTYTTGKLGTPNDRFQTVIGHMRQVRHLGFLHYEMTKTKNMMAEDVTQPR